MKNLAGREEKKIKEIAPIIEEVWNNNYVKARKEAESKEDGETEKDWNAVEFCRLVCSTVE